MPRFGVSGGPRLGRTVAPGLGSAGPVHNLNYREKIGSRGHFQYRWRGADFVNLVNRATFVGMNKVANEAEVAWRQIVHVISGHLRDSANFIVDVDRRGRLVFILRNEAHYADFEERGTIYREGHFPIRQTMDRVVPRINTIMLTAYRQAGLR